MAQKHSFGVLVQETGAEDLKNWPSDTEKVLISNPTFEPSPKILVLHNIKSRKQLMSKIMRAVISPESNVSHK